ncbi:MAG: lamin tail domain-containing protein, partial [Bacteroidales bacterium]
AIAVQQIKFYGIREEGSDIFFDSQPDVPFGIYAISKNQPPPLVNAFDIPQGVYNQMRWEIQTREIDEDYYEEFFDEELNEYIDVDNFGIIIEGTYTKLDGTQILLFIAIDPAEILLMETFDTGGNNQLSLLSGQSYNVRLEINPYTAIENIERSLLELAATNDDDDDDDYEDWIELHNPTENTINLLGYGLSDDYSDPYRWILPDINLASGAYLLIWASGKDRNNTSAPLHTNFSISSDGEEIILTNPSGMRIDEIEPTPVPTDI